MASVLAALLGDRSTAATVVALSAAPGLARHRSAHHRMRIVASAAVGEIRGCREDGARDALRATRPDDLVIVALSGGASAMFALPPEGVPLADKITLTQSLLRSGASIRELNTVRKHLSMVKGGHLVRAANGARVLSLILSDVPGDDLATIGSGLTAPDPTTFADAIAVLKRRHLWGRAPETIRDYLERGNAGEVAETPKSDDPIFARVTNTIIGSNRPPLDAAAKMAASLGYSVDRFARAARRGQRPRCGARLTSDRGGSG